MSSTEYLSKDILEDDYIRSFAPFRYLEMILGTSRINLRDKFVTGPTQPQKVYSLVCAGATLALYLYAAVTFFEKYRAYSDLYNTFILVTVLHYVTFVCNIIHVRFINTDTNSKFYIQMQEIDRLMKLDKSYLNNIMFRINACTVVVATVIVMATFICGLFPHYILVVAFIGFFFGVLSCAIEWLHCANLIVYFFLRMRCINAIISNYLDGKLVPREVKNHHNRWPTPALLRHLVSTSHHFESSPVDDYVEALFNAFSAFQKLYRFQILLFCSHFFIHTLISFEIEILSAQKGLINSNSWMEFMDLPTLTALSFMIAIVISFRCEVFLGEVKRTKRLCVTVLSRHYDGPVREKAKRILCAISARPPQLDVYNMWRMDAATVLSMINIITTLMVAQLQFILL